MSDEKNCYGAAARMEDGMVELRLPGGETHGLRVGQAEGLQVELFWAIRDVVRAREMIMQHTPAPAAAAGAVKREESPAGPGAVLREGDRIIPAVPDRKDWRRGRGGVVMAELPASGGRWVVVKWNRLQGPERVKVEALVKVDPM